MEPRELLAAAQEAQLQAYAPYSHHPVGAALLGKSGAVYVGCNVENASFGLTSCAERNAVFQAVAAGERQFEALALVTPRAGTPCGACRQVLREFAEQLPVYLARAVASGTPNLERITNLATLLPEAFGSAAVHPEGDR